MRKVILSFWGLLFIVACQIKESTPSKQQTTHSPNSEGEALARAHCVGCHQFPNPSLLSKTTWEDHVLPRMGVFLNVIPVD